MKIARNMEAIFVTAVAMSLVANLAYATPDSNTLPDRQVAQQSAQVQTVVVTAKRADFL